MKTEQYINILKGWLALMIPSAVFLIYFPFVVVYWWSLHDNIYAQVSTVVLIGILILCYHSMKSIVGYHKIIHRRIK